jgi:hypothetical protein
LSAAGALLVFVGVSEDMADFAPILAFTLGVGLGLWGWSCTLVWVIRERAKD